LEGFVTSRAAVEKQRRNVIMVVSDAHFGLGTSLYNDFSKFLDWLRNLEKEGKMTIIREDGDEKVIEKPEELILLGDILELWTPVAGEYHSVTNQTKKIDRKLCELRCDKTYILGNHDEEFDNHMITALTNNLKIEEVETPVVGMSEYLSKGLRIPRKFREKFQNSYRLPNGSILRVVPDHYPESHEYISCGTERYFFLHGHQFDKLFEWAGWLKEVPPAMGKLSIKLGLGGWGFVALFFFFILAPVVALFTPILDTYFFLPFSLFTSVIHQLVILMYSIAHLSGTPPSHLKVTNLSYLAITLLLFLLSIPKLFTVGARAIWNAIKQKSPQKPKYLEIDRVINEGYYKKERDTIVANNVVFGHTHVPGMSGADIYQKLGKNFINSGSWVNEPHFQHNSIVYIDQQGTMLLQWEPKKKQVIQLPKL
jgi:UDP-2,3-diacylglucosamine pyrophosphatase LpxH